MYCFYAFCDCFLASGATTGRSLRNCAMFSVRPTNRHSLHSALIKFYNDGQITCSWHLGRIICEHKVAFGESIEVSLTEMRDLRERIYGEKNRESDTFIVKPISTRRVPLHPDHRYVIRNTCIAIRAHIDKQ